jgi:hypothetical protein
MPNSPSAQGMLARTIHGLLDQHLDQEIERAIATAPDISVARFIRRESEAACESVDVTTHGMVLRSRLFCVAILAEFPELVSAVDFNNALRSFEASDLLCGFPFTGWAGADTFQLLPYFFSFEDLVPIPLSMLRTANVIGPRRLGIARRKVMCLCRRKGQVRPARVFLRCLLGHKAEVVTEQGLSHNTKVGIAKWISQLLSGFFEEAPRVTSLYNGRFFDPLHTGLWLYQNARIAHAVASIAESAGSLDRIRATVSVHGSISKYEVRVGFFMGSDLCRHHAYSLRPRPLEDPARCVERVRMRLVESGVANVSPFKDFPAPETRTPRQPSLIDSVGNAIHAPVVIPV